MRNYQACKELRLSAKMIQANKHLWESDTGFVISDYIQTFCLPVYQFTGFLSVYQLFISLPTFYPFTDFLSVNQLFIHKYDIILVKPTFT